MLSEITPIIKILPLRPKGEKTVGSNSILLDGKLQMNFEKQYNLLYNLPAEARAFSPREAASEQLNSFWWCVLNEARTFFENTEV